MTKHELEDAVYEQIGCDDRQEFLDRMTDVSNYGADQGVPGFCYYNETAGFFEKHQSAIVRMVKEMADDFGQDPISFVAGFQCLEDDAETRDQIGRCIYGTPGDEDYFVENALAWFALEEVARTYDR